MPSTLDGLAREIPLKRPRGSLLTGTEAAHTFGATSWMPIRMNSRTTKALQIVACVALCAPIPAHAQRPEWTVTTSAPADVWFHALAVVGFQGFGPLDFYDVRYAATVRDVKRHSGRPPSLLDRKARYFRDHFAADSAFEVLHFVPLHFLKSDVESMLATLAAAADGGGQPHRDGQAQRAAEAITRALGGGNRRKLLREFVEAVDDEWRGFLRDYSHAQAASRDARVALTRRRWNEDYAPSLWHTLASAGVSRGTVVLSPALGAEGRIFEAGDRTVVAVTLAASGSDADAEPQAIVRELCFPLLRRAPPPLAFGRDRVTMERMNSARAVGCGAITIARVNASLRLPYEQRYLQAAGIRANDRAAPKFDEVFPVDDPTRAYLSRMLYRGGGQ